MGFYSPRALIMDAQRHGVKFLDVDIQKSEYDYTIEKDGVRSGFRAIYGLKEKHVEQLLEERKRGGEFRDLNDLIRRTHLAKSALIQLAAAGAFVCIGLEPREALWKIQALSLDAQSLLFGTERGLDSDLLPQEDDWEKLQREFQVQGYSLLRHPIGLLRPALERWSDWERKRNFPGFSKAVHLPHLQNRTKVRVAGLLSLQQRPPTAKGFAFLTLEDETGLINIVLLPQIYEKYRLEMLANPMLHICGTLEKVESVINIKAEIIKGLPVEKMLKATPDANTAGVAAEQSPPGFDFTKCIDDHTLG
jgi:DNA polymerase III alpha subunit